MQKNISENQKNILKRKGIVSYNHSLIFVYSGGRTVMWSFEKNLSEHRENPLSEICGICYVCESKNIVAAIDMDKKAHIFFDGKPYLPDGDTLCCSVQVACGLNHAAILKEDGHVVCIGSTDGGKCNTSDWENTVDICCGKGFTAGLNKDGSITCTGKGSKSIIKKFGKYRLNAIFANPEKNSLYAIDIDGRIILPSGKPLPGISDVVFISPITSPIIVCDDGRIFQKGNLVNIFQKEKNRKPILCVGNEKLMFCLTSDGILKPSIKNSRGNIRLFQSFDILEEERRVKKEQADNLSQRIEKCAAYAQKFKNTVRCSSSITVAVNSGEHAYSTMYTKSVEKLSGAIEADCSNGHIAILLANGRVQSFGNNQNGCCNTYSWHGIVSVCVGSDITLGIKNDGSVNIAGKSAGINTSPISKWKGIKKIKCESEYIAALDQYGKILICGNAPFDTEMTKNIDGIEDFCLSPAHIVLVLKDRSVISFGSNRYGECNTGSWKNIRMTVCSEGYTAALDYNGRVYAVGINSLGQCDTASFSNSVFIACGKHHIASLDIDGKITCTGAEGYGQCRVSGWKNIVSVFCGDEYTIALASNGVLYACGKNTDGQCMVSPFRIFNSADTYDKEKNESAGRRLAQNGTADSVDILSGNTQSPSSDAVSENPLRCARMEKLSTKYFDLKDRLAINKAGSCAVCTEDGVAVFGKTNSFDNKKLLHIYPGDDYFGYIDIDGNIGFIGCKFNVSDVTEGLKAVDMCCTKSFCAVVYEDGSVKSFSDKQNGEPSLDLSDLCDIVKISCTNQYILGLTSSGFVKLKQYAQSQTDSNNTNEIPHDNAICENAISHPAPSPTLYEITNYGGISDIFTHEETAVAIMSDGRVMIFEDRYDCALDIKELSMISLVSMSDNFIALADSERHVHTYGKGDSGECDTGQWQDIISVYCLDDGIIALDTDGNIHLTQNTYKSLQISDAVAIYGCLNTFYYANYSGRLFRVCDGIIKDTGYSLFIPSKKKNRITMTFPNRINTDLYSSIGISNTEILLIDDSKRMTVYKNISYMPYVLSRDSVSCADCGSLHISYIQNGTLHITGDNSYGQCELDRYERIKYICCSSLSSVAVSEDGKVYACGAITMIPDIDRLRNISDAVMSACGSRHVAILQKDGKVSCVGDNSSCACNTSEWENISMIACGDRHTVGLSVDGRIYSTGDNSCMQLPDRNLSGVMSIACAPYSTACIMYDGTIKPFGFSPNVEKKLLSITDCVAAKARENRILILHSSGKAEII